MGDIVNAFPESLDEVVAAVRETARGRWFLDQYEARLKSADTTRILGAIARLETHVHSMSSSGAGAEILHRAREALAAAKRDLAALEPANSDLSPEAHAFAKLAAKAKAAFSSAPEGAGIARALELVDELDRELAPKSSAAHAETSQYFHQDAALFETAPTPQAASAKQPAAEEPHPQNRGAKLVIRRACETPAAAKEQSPALAAQEPPAIISSKAQPQAEHAQSRIVIIRRKADELEALPLPGDEQSSPASAA